MKFRIKLNTQTYTIAFDQLDNQSMIIDLKQHIQIHFSLLKKVNFHLSLNGKDFLEENQTISQSTLVNGDTIYILIEISKENSSSSMNMPLTLDEVRDSNIYPILIHRLIEHSQPENDFDYMIILIHTFMVESGFQMDFESNYDLKIARKSSTFYIIRYRHKLCEQERIRCSLAIMKTDSLITIDGVVNSISQACGKLSLNIGDYFQIEKQSNSHSVLPYYHLRDLSRLFKDNIANRLLCKLLEESGQRSSATLVGLPNEIKLRLAKYLPIKSLHALQSTCRDIYNTLNDNLLWRDLCLRDFDKNALTSISISTDKDWRQHYRILYAQKQASLRHQTKSCPFFHPAFIPLSTPGHPSHRVLFPDPTNGASPGFHPFPPAIYRPIPPGIFRICTANTQSQSSTQQHLYCQTFFGLKWVVIFAAATMIPFPPCFHPVWLG